ADDEVAVDALAQAAMGLAVPSSVEVVTRTVATVNYPALAADGVRTLVLFRDVAAAVSARAGGLPDGVLNVGNVHAGPGRHAVTRTVFLSGDEEAQLTALDTSGMEVVLQAVPAERPMHLGRS
ncbi:MAG: PTS sugar transporter subunit IIB, partial [Archangium sp.]|nr:PTS sugar transporter subunit IIB [Archangium sp.]